MTLYSRLSTGKKILLALCIVLPPLGAFGVHDFIVGDKKHGKNHVAMVILGLFASPLIMMIMICDNGCSGTKAMLVSFLAYLGIALAFFPLASYVWAIVECVQIFLGRK